MSAEPRLIGAEELRARLPMAAAIDALEDGVPNPRRRRPARFGRHVETPERLAAADAGVRRGRCRREARHAHAGEPRARAAAYVQASYVLFDAGHAVARGRPRRGRPHRAPDRRRLRPRDAIPRARGRGDARRSSARASRRRSHLEAMCAVRPVTELVVVSRSRAAAESLVEDGLGRGLAARVGDPDAVADADLVCTCTTSEEPLFDGSLLRPGGPRERGRLASTRTPGSWTRRRSVGRRVVVETREVALAEAGELAIPIAEGAIDRRTRGRRPRRDGPGRARAAVPGGRHRLQERGDGVRGPRRRPRDRRRPVTVGGAVRGAGRGGRTLTGRSPRVFETRASADSAIPAGPV